MQTKKVRWVVLAVFMGAVALLVCLSAPEIGKAEDGGGTPMGGQWMSEASMFAAAGPPRDGLHRRLSLRFAQLQLARPAAAHPGAGSRVPDAHAWGRREVHLLRGADRARRAAGLRCGVLERREKHLFHLSVCKLIGRLDLHRLADPGFLLASAHRQ